MMTTEAAPAGAPSGEGLTFEKVWLMFQETDRKFREQMEEADRKFREEMKEADRKFREETEEADRKFREEMKEAREQTEEADRKLREQMKETDRRFRETDRKISKLGSRLGELIEHLTGSNILEKFQEFRYDFTRVSRNHKIKDAQGQILAEIDLLLENGEFAMVIEVKSLCTVEDVKEHLRRMETLRRYAEAHGDRRRYLGSVSGALIEGRARDFALESGLYVIEQTGDTVRIREPPKRMEWQALS